MGLEVHDVDTRTAPGSVLEEMHSYYIALDAESLPDDPPMVAEQRLANWRNIPDHAMIPRWLLRDDGEIVAVGVAYLDKYDDVNNGIARVHVREDQRRRGHARVLAGAMFDLLESEGRKSIITDVIDGAEWESKLEDIGLKKSYQDKRSRLWVSDIDWGLMGDWVEKAAQRASGYHLLYLETPIPDEHIANWCKVHEVMHTAPREDLEFEDENWDPDKWLAYEEKLSAAGTQMVGHVAVHSETGQFVGLSDIFVEKYQPEIAWQGDTGVDQQHRNKGLGRWLKAATILKIREDHPVVDRIDTENAASNDAMLNINIEMGYRPILRTNAWQGDLALVRERLGV